MEVLAIIRKFADKEKAEAIYAGSVIGWGGIFKSTVKALTPKIVKGCAEQLAEERVLYTFSLEGFNNIAYGFRQGNDWSVFAVKAELDETTLAYHFLKNSLNQALKLADMIGNPESYTLDLQISRLQADIDTTKVILQDAIEKVVDRGGNLEALVEKTAELEVQSVRFQKNSAELNSCWPSFCNLL